VRPHYTTAIFHHGVSFRACSNFRAVCGKREGLRLPLLCQGIEWDYRIGAGVRRRVGCVSRPTMSANLYTVTSERLYPVWTITGVPGIGLETETEVSLGTSLSLLSANPLLLSAVDSLDLNKQQCAEMTRCAWFLVHRAFQSPTRDAERDKSVELLQDALMAFQAVKPMETYGLIFQGVEFEQDRVTWESKRARWPMSAGEWARIRSFDQELLAQTKGMLGRIQSVMVGSDIGRKNAVHLLQLALEHPHPSIACLLAVTGMEAIFDSKDRWDFEARLCDLLGESTLAFPDWNSPDFSPLPYTVKELAVHLYALRSKVAHGADLRKALHDKNSPVDLFQFKEYVPLTDPVRYATLLGESSIYLLCQVLQKVL
jgi:hypothetical protein